MYLTYGLVLHNLKEGFAVIVKIMKAHQECQLSLFVPYRLVHLCMYIECIDLN